MGFSEFLQSRREAAAALVRELRKQYEYVSVLGADVKARMIRADQNTTGIRPGGDTDCGFVVKARSGGVVLEYSLDDLTEDTAALAAQIADFFRLSAALQAKAVEAEPLQDEPLVQSFAREDDLTRYTDAELLDFCKAQQRDISAGSEFVRNAIVELRVLEVSKLFVSENRQLDQHYVWVNGMVWLVYEENGKMIQTYESANHPLLQTVLEELPEKKAHLLHKAHMLTTAKPIEPGVYDVITDSSISGLIAHEAFGHGVELDQFVKDRALAKEYMGKYVASPICNMRDGAASTVSAASYFFDDDGVPAGDTQIIKDGILVAGISDLASAAQLKLAPTGNGRRESTRRKAYARMTNTFFEAGKDKLEDMIASVEHGYMLFETNNGMEDPKNWAIQCVAEYGIEIENGKLTDRWVSPVVMSGYVPDLLQSISMVSDQCKIIGAGGCGKGYKEWVRVSDGGPALKVRVKLG